MTQAPAYEAGRWYGKGIAEWVPEVVEAVVGALNPAKVILFGSLARDEAGPDSDIDLLVVLDHAPEDRRIPLAVAAHRAISPALPVDVVITDRAEVERRGHLKGWLLYPALHEEGVVVHERTA